MIYLLLAEGFEEIEALMPLDLLRRAGLDVQTVAITRNPVCGAHGIRVTADITPSEANEPIELLLLPGGMPGAANLDAAPEVDALLSRAVANGGHIGAICAAPMILGRRGLLAGRRATCFPGFEGELLGANLQPGARVITDGPVTTAIGMGAAGEFGLALLHALGHAEKAEELKGTAFLPA